MPLLQSLAGVVILRFGRTFFQTDKMEKKKKIERRERRQGARKDNRFPVILSEETFRVLLHAPAQGSIFVLMDTWNLLLRGCKISSMCKNIRNKKSLHDEDFR